MDPLEVIRKQIASGQLRAAQRAPMALLRTNPHHMEAWLLLATLLEDPQQQADCYRQVLSLDPGHPQASRALAPLTASVQREGTALRCPQCGGAMEIYFAGELHDKRARCPYCGTDVDLPDSFQRVQRHHTSEQSAGVQRFEDTLTIESRSDSAAASLTSEDIARLMQAQAEDAFDLQGLMERARYDHTFTKEDLQRILAEHGLSLNDEKLADMLDRYIFAEREGGAPGERVVIRRIETRRNFGQAFSPQGAERPGCLSGLLRIFGESRVRIERVRPAPPPDMNVETIVHAAGGPLPPEERRPCPQCGATLSKHARRCSWCGAWVESGEGRR